MTIKPIRNETDYDEVLAEIDHLMGVAAGTPESDRLEVLVTQMEGYESEHWDIDAPDPISAITREAATRPWHSSSRHDPNRRCHRSRPGPATRTRSS